MPSGRDAERLRKRQIGRLYQVYLTGPDATPELVLTDPLLVLRITDETPQAPVRPDASVRGVNDFCRCIASLSVLLDENRS